ncbi:hypothetical protein BDV19DRAFT_358490 [Aspergillus venezuelensis]
MMSYFLASLFMMLLSIASTTSAAAVHNVPELAVETSDSSDPNTPTLLRRGTIEAYAKTWRGDFQCDNPFGVIKPLALKIATVIKGRSDGHACGSISWFSDGYQLQYYATGPNCYTAASKEDIAGAIHRLFSKKGICRSECIRLNHGGPWNGYLKMTPKKHFSDAPFCTTDMDFPRCFSGSRDDF